MLERFKVKDTNLDKVSETKLRKLVENIFLKMGVPESDSVLATDVLLSADLRGVDSHGVSNMLRKYVRDYKTGELNPNPKWKIIKESLSVASIDSDSGLGLIIAPKAMEIAIEKAKKTGIGIVTIKNSGHMGMLAYYSMQALKHNMIGLVMSSSKPTVLPTFGSEPRIGTNPISLAAPCATETPFVYDAATSVISSNKLNLAKRLEVSICGGWVADKQGTPIMNELSADQFNENDWPYKNILPLGSNPEMGSHKGYGLACVVEILSGILASAGHSLSADRKGYSHTVAAYDINSFTDVEQFKDTMDEWVKILKSTKPAPGNDRVYYPGEIEAENEIKYKAEGIPLHKEVTEWLKSTCLGLTIPWDLN